MKNIHFYLLIGILIVSINSDAQTLNNQFNLISVDNDMMGGSVVVFCEDGIIENLAIGASDYSRDIIMTIDSKYRIASISKTITAIAIMQLVEQNLLDLDENISAILGFDIKNPSNPDDSITVRMLLSHTSSIIDGTTYGNFLSATVNNTTIPNLSEILSPVGIYYTSEQFNNTVPGTYFNYANINYVILGTIVEKVSNLRFDVYCKQNISDPLGIDASFNVNDLIDIDQVAVLYRKSGGVWTPQVDNYQGVQPVHNNLSNYIPGTNGGRFGPQGGFRCSAKDLAKIFLVLMNKGTFDNVTLLSEVSCNLMFADEWTYNGSNGNNYYGLFRSWGLGIHRITSTPGNDIALPESQFMLGHAGEAYGLVSDAFFDTERKVGFVFLTNGIGVGYQTNNYSMFYTVEQAVFDALENHGNINNCLQNNAVKQTETSKNILYPNPSNECIYIANQNSNKEIEIFNTSGVLIKRINLEIGDNQINIKDLKKGMYILMINEKKYSFIKL